MNILEKLLQNHPIRRTDSQKQAFRDYVQSHCAKSGMPCEVVDVENNKNIVIGNPKTAKILLTAHYDTPAMSLFPNMLIPKNTFFRLLYHLSYPVLLAFAALAVSYGITALIGNEAVWVPLYLVLYLGSFYLLTRTFVNPSNANDNTSGVATVLSIVSKMADKLTEKGIACILFDNEEKGLKGSKAFAKQYKGQLNDTLVLNFDCVGDGDHILFVAKPKADQNPLYHAIKEALSQRQEKTTVFLSAKQASCNSDQKNFEQGVGIVACHRRPIIGYVAGKIHTRRDTVCDQSNVDALVSSFVSLFESTL